MRAGAADNRSAQYCGSIGLEHSDGVRGPSVDEDRLVGKAGEDEGRDLALLQRCRGSIVASLLVSTASVSALVVVGNDVASYVEDGPELCVSTAPWQEDDRYDAFVNVEIGSPQASAQYQAAASASAGLSPPAGTSLVIACRVPAADSASISVRPDAPAKSSVAIATITSFCPDKSSYITKPPDSSGNQEIDAVSAATTSQISDDGFASDEDYTYDEGEEKEEEGGETTDAESETDEDPPQVDEVPPEERAYPYVRVVGTERMTDGEIRAWVEWEDTLEPFSALYPADARALARYLRRPQQMPVGPPTYHYEGIRGIHYPADGDLRVLMNWPNTLEPLSNLVPADREQVERANGIAGN
ncbi:hypothetical protein PHYSODRAFT_329058 [Phytophthora sojae]|uniref:Uncharacterized protein n=1 Tax=Phytophthora sojae (strain P6497) TaxID=1094619 RepID=G4Z6W3_PHYSP|nr:hypothetical protein PHYSODRAFT_329058 [Phytophthora sojae]EGZ21019.1 hypothetical protein PHYSODRAFT_329058 [Phytophthora sojae]|eukprot:XP_009523736.1 hypothetical protein PHYSODRAFT_329058 [Phytophthora sojae]